MIIPCAALEVGTFSWTTVIFIEMLICVLFFALVISCLVRASRYFRNTVKEQKLMRMEFGKLADEVKQIRQGLKHE